MITITSNKLADYDQVGEIILTTSVATKDYLLRVTSNFRPVEVTLDDTPLAECADRPAFDGSLSGCAWLNELGGRTLVKYSTTAAGSTVVLTPGDPLLCGNGTRDACEECDDGNLLAGAGCSAYLPN